MVSRTITALLFWPEYGTKWLRRYKRPPDRLVRALATSNTGSPRMAFCSACMTGSRDSDLNSNASSHCGRSRGSVRRPQRRGSEPCACTTRPCASTSQTSTGSRAIRSPALSTTRADAEPAAAIVPTTGATAPAPRRGAGHADHAHIAHRARGVAHLHELVEHGAGAQRRPVHAVDARPVRLGDQIGERERQRIGRRRHLGRRGKFARHDQAAAVVAEPGPALQAADPLREALRILEQALPVRTAPALPRSARRRPPTWRAPAP